MSNVQDRVDEENGGEMGTEAAARAPRNLLWWFPSRGGNWSFGWRKIQISDSSTATDATPDATAASASPTETTEPAALSEIVDYSKDNSGGEAAACAPAARMWRWVWSRRDILLMSTAFLFFFVAFNALQNVATSIHGASNIGALSMGVLYAVIVVTAPLAPFPIRFWRARAAILVAQTGFWAFIGSNAFTIEWLLLLASCYLGVCWSVVWVAQGVYLVAAAGVYSKRYNKPMDVVRSVSASAVSGRPILTRSATFKRMTVTVGGGSKEGEGRNAWQLLFDRKLLLLIPLLFYSGLQAAYISADFTRYVVQPLLGAQWMGGAMMVFGVAIAVVIRFAKGLSSIRLMLLLGAASQTAVLILTWLFQDRAMSQPAAFALVLSCALLWGIGATAFQSQITALLPLVFPSDVDAAYAPVISRSSAASMCLLSCPLSHSRPPPPP
ncbi:unnamed protein product [Closterium sp. Naga37s-1]|nr:unnamed protein product [Closterium sp. Naga37s-1]